MNIKQYIAKHHNSDRNRFINENIFDKPVSYQNVMDWEKAECSVLKVEGVLKVFPRYKREFRRI